MSIQRTRTDRPLIHDELLSHRPEEQVSPLVNPLDGDGDRDGKTEALYARWRYWRYWGCREISGAARLRKTSAGDAALTAMRCDAPSAIPRALPLFVALPVTARLRYGVVIPRGPVNTRQASVRNGHGASKSAFPFCVSKGASLGRSASCRACGAPSSSRLLVDVKSPIAVTRKGKRAPK